MKLLTLGWSQYLMVLLGLSTMAVITAIEFEPIDGLTDVLFRLASQKYERQFGFEIGKIPEWPHSPPGGIWGVARVTPGGRFDRAGIHGGDVVTTYHGGGFGALYYALKSADAGDLACLDIASLADWQVHRYISHEVCLNGMPTSMSSVPKPPPGLCERSGDWDTVLALAAQPLAQSRGALERAARDANTDASLLAAFVLQASRRKGIFRRSTPRLLRPVALGGPVLEAAVATPHMSLNVSAQVDIDPRGCPIRVSLWKETPDEPLARLVVEALQHAVYVPAKSAGGYITSRLWFTTIIDVRR